MWNFVAHGETRLFRQWVGTADTVGDEHMLLNGKAHLQDKRFTATGEPGIVRGINATALLEGEIEILYDGWPSYTMSGFVPHKGHTNLWQSGPLAPMRLTALAVPTVWWCCTARLRTVVPEVVAVAFEQGLAGETFSFGPRRSPTYVIPLSGSVTLGPIPWDRYEIVEQLGMTPIDGKFNQDGVVAFIWRR